MLARRALTTLAALTYHLECSSRLSRFVMSIYPLATMRIESRTQWGFVDIGWRCTSHLRIEKGSERESKQDGLLVPEQLA
jgi:hypothetical protein